MWRKRGDGMDKAISDLLVRLINTVHELDIYGRGAKYTQQKRDEELLFKVLMASDIKVEDVKDEYKDLARVILKHKEEVKNGEK